MKKDLDFSFELLPSRKESEMVKMVETAKALSVLQPNLYIIANALWDSEPADTLTATRMVNRLDIGSVAPTISTIGATQESIITLLDRYKAEGIYNLLVLRGLSRPNIDVGDFPNAQSLISFIKKHYHDFFTLHSTAYPEVHPKAISPQADLNHTVEKIQAGSSSSISLYFYNIESFLFLRDQLIKKGCFAPLIPSINPITNWDELTRFSQLHGVEIPRWLALNLNSYKENPEDFKRFGSEVVITLCERLIKEGVTHFHFHTHNNAESVLQIANLLLDRTPY